MIVFVQLLSLAIWCRSLLIMIISESLSCIVHLCNGSAQDARSPLLLLPFLCTHSANTRHQKPKPKYFGVSLRQDTEAQKRLHTILFFFFKRKNVFVFISFMVGFEAAGTIDETSQYFPAQNNLGRRGERNYSYKAVFIFCQAVINSVGLGAAPGPRATPTEQDDDGGLQTESCGGGGCC